MYTNRSSSGINIVFENIVNKTEKNSVTFISFNPIPPGGGGRGGVPAPISTFENFLDI